ncbi:EamA family transporter [Xenorhabdus bovienii]|uniref:EamA family transporter n=1 Tax=Xenorhabdus bovienii TaxID=40576 RepID=UPI0021588F52|nr:EamA family transporter [Xenorhabdus bovienii]
MINKYVFFILSSIICQSLTYGILSGNSGGNILLFVSQGFFLTSAFYLLMALLKNKAVRMCHVIILIKLNISTAIAFLCFYLSIYFIPASISSLIEAAAGPLWGVIIGYLFFTRDISIKPLLLTFVIFISSMVVLFIENSGKFFLNDGIGIMLSLAAALGATLIAFSSKNSEEIGLSAVTILGYRFHFTWVLSLIIYQQVSGEVLLTSFKWEYFALAFVGITLPMYFLQIGMQRVDPLVTMVCFSFVPVITYLFESLFGKELNFVVLGLLLLSVILAVIQIKRML